MSVVYDDFPSDFNTKYLMSYVDNYVEINSRDMYYNFRYSSGVIIFKVNILNIYNVFINITTRRFSSSDYLVWSRDCLIKELLE